MWPYIIEDKCVGKTPRGVADLCKQTPLNSLILLGLLVTSFNSKMNWSNELSNELSEPLKLKYIQRTYRYIKNNKNMNHMEWKEIQKTPI